MDAGIAVAPQAMEYERSLGVDKRHNVITVIFYLCRGADGGRHAAAQPHVELVDEN
jgi:hypothetical protein